jgi:hypothetical protein
VWTTSTASRRQTSTFHITTAYGILRHRVADIGKRDFLGGIPMRIT